MIRQDSTSSLLADVHAYRRLVGKIIYLAITCYDITYMAGLRQFMHADNMLFMHVIT